MYVILGRWRYIQYGDLPNGSIRSSLDLRQYFVLQQWKIASDEDSSAGVSV